MNFGFRCSAVRIWWTKFVGKNMISFKCIDFSNARFCEVSHCCLNCVTLGKASTCFNYSFAQIQEKFLKTPIYFENLQILKQKKEDWAGKMEALAD